MTAPIPAFLDHYLGPLEPWLAREDVTDIYINGPGELWLESLNAGIERIECAELTPKALERLARQIAAYSHQGVSREHPILSATLPDGARVQVVIPPATRGHVAMAIRKHVVIDRSLADYAGDGSFRATDLADRRHQSEDRELVAASRPGDVAALLALAVRQKRNILISGGTSTGKTTFLNALIREIPVHERLILIEDTPEVRIHHDNAVGLIAARSRLGESAATSEDLLNAALRMRPDRIILGEIRGQEAFTFLRAINTGHPGSMTTIHADSPDRALEQLALLVLQTGTQLRRQDVLDYVSSVIDLFVQLDRSDGARAVSEVRIAEHLMIGKGAR